MEGFTLVLVSGWVILVGTFTAMYFMDRATKRAVERRAAQTAQSSEKTR